MDSQRPRPSTKRRTALQLVIGLAFAGLFGWFFLRSSNPADLLNALQKARIAPIVAAVAVAVLGLWIRGVRWRCYLKPVADVPTRDAFEILIIGYFVSNFLPGRPGDLVVRPALLRRERGLPLASSLATIAVERLFDTMMVAVIFATYLAFFAPESVGDLDLAPARMAGWLMLLAAAYAVRLLIGLRVHRERCLGIFARLLSPLPERMRVVLVSQARSFADGLSLFADPWNALRTVGQSFLAWVTVAVSMWLVAQSLGMQQVRVVDGMLLVGLGALGVAIPTPGGVGSLHYLLFLGLQGLGVEASAAGAGAVLIWAVSWVPVNVMGLWFSFRRGVRPARVAVEPVS